MCKKFILKMFLVIIFVALIGCSINNKEDVNDKNNNSSHQNIEQPKTEVDQIKEQIKDMSLEKKIGQMVIVGLKGYFLENEAKDLIDNYYVSGFILFKDNMENSQQILKLTNELKNANTKNNIPLFLSVDEEGGRVSRLPNEFEKQPSNRIIGLKNDNKLSYEIGSRIAEDIKYLGFNMNFAPVLDIDSNPDNPVIGDRSFGSDEKIVSELGIETMKGMQSNGVISVVKHFPGHGDTAVDSHIGLPTVDKDLDSLMEFELVPFIKAIESNADAIMVAHILFNNIDPENPATMSKSIITNLLRVKLKFDGLVITDDMTMGAIMENYDIGSAAVKSIDAGSDIVLVCHGYENEIKVLDAIKDAVKDGTLSEERIDESLYRILKQKESLTIRDRS